MFYIFYSFKVKCHVPEGHKNHILNHILEGHKNHILEGHKNHILEGRKSHMPSRKDTYIYNTMNK